VFGVFGSGVLGLAGQAKICQEIPQAPTSMFHVDAVDSGEAPRTDRVIFTRTAA